MAMRPWFSTDPYYEMDNWIEVMDRYHNRFWNDPWFRPAHMNFGLGIPSNRLREMLEFPLSERFDQLMREAEAEFKDGFQVCMDVQQFKPNEIKVRTFDNSVVIEGKHEERPDQHGYISRQFVRRYTLPPGYEVDKIMSTLSSDGVLTIKAPPPQNAIKGSKERFIPIQQTGPARLIIKANEE
jgi:HSP20 family molecular chaperone IbpA